MMDLIDTHTHLNLDDYAEDRNEVIERALEVGLTRILLPGVTLESCLTAIPLCDAHEGFIFFALGVHPNDVSKGSGWNAKVISQFRQLAQHRAFVAIGETGLDYYWDDSPIPAQHQALREHVALARELNRPLIIHVRDKAGSSAAYDDLLEILQSENAQSVGGVMHCFSGSQAFAEASIALNFSLAFGGVITFKNARELQDVVRNVPIERILLETDSPWLAPTPYRGKRNEPSYVRYVAEQVAALKGLSPEEVATATSANARALFRF